MGSVLNFFDFIGTFFENIWEIITNFFRPYLLLLELIPSSLLLPKNLIGYVPAVIGVSMIMVGCVAAVKLIAGRQ